MKKFSEYNRFLWVDALKAFALLGIILNHIVEEFYPDPWFTNPSNDWLEFGKRMLQLLPPDHQSVWSNLLMYLGWLGDSCPGVFIILSGFTLALSFYRSDSKFNMLEFYRKRLLRIFPLYIFFHLAVLLVLIFKVDTNIASPNNLLSLLGIRFSNSLFYHINPSWWFVWLILQLYIIFPFLMVLIKKSGIKAFAVLTISITLISRLVGILDLQHFNSMYIWMTGSFFGTRLAEFAAGIIGAYVLINRSQELQKWTNNSKVFLISSGIYLLGLILSFTLFGSLVSNLLVSLGLCGIFLSIWRWIGIRLVSFRKGILWVGYYSFSIFLIHQFILKQTIELFASSHILLTVTLAILLSFFIGWMAESLLKRLTKLYSTIKLRWLKILQISSGLVLLGSIYILESKLHNELKYNLFLFFILCLSILLCVLFVKNVYSKVIDSWALVSIFIGLIYVTIMPKDFGKISLIIFLIFTPIVYFFFYVIRQKFWASMVSVLTILSVSATFEFILSKNPKETLVRWGEFPALQLHPTRIYALIPNKTTRLRYNNYNYILKTNSYGLASPPIDSLKPATDCFRILLVGDAFTMPEGLEYDNSYGYLLEASLRNKFPNQSIQVINGGVTGYGPNESYQELNELTRMFKPDLIFYEFFINEFDEINLTPQARLQDIGLIKRKTTKVLANSQVLIQLRAFSNGLEEMRGKVPASSYTKSLLRFYDKKDSGLYSPETMKKMDECLLSMYNIAAKNNSRFVICFVPGSVCVSKKSDIQYFPKNVEINDSTRFDFLRPLKYLHSITDAHKINVLDLTSSLKNYSDQPVYFPDSWHWNKNGHKAVSNELVNYILNNNLLVK